MSAVSQTGTGTDIASGNGYLTPSTARACLACGKPMPTGRLRRYCDDRCRQTGWRRRNQSAEPPAPMAAPGSRQRNSTVYACPECDGRYLGEQRCPDCNTFCTRLGLGGICPCCDELVVVAELVNP